MRTYDDWKTDVDEVYQGPSNKQIGEAIAKREEEIAWLKKRLDTLILDEEDREQTLDYLKELEDELNSLLWCFGWPASGGVRLGTDHL